jgi:hypothetical protein
MYVIDRHKVDRETKISLFLCSSCYSESVHSLLIWAQRQLNVECAISVKGDFSTSVSS